jgi:hypothetical protein
MLNRIICFLFGHKWASHIHRTEFIRFDVCGVAKGYGLNPKKKGQVSLALFVLINGSIP